MTEQDLIAGELLDKAATPGPWEHDGMHPEITTPYADSYWLIVSECRSAPDQPLPDAGHGFDANFALICWLRNHAEELLREYRKAKIARSQSEGID